MMATDTWLHFSEIHSDANRVGETSLVKGGGHFCLIVMVCKYVDLAFQKKLEISINGKKSASFKRWQLILLTNSTMPAKENLLGLA